MTRRKGRYRSRRDFILPVLAWAKILQHLGCDCSSADSVLSACGPPLGKGERDDVWSRSDRNVLLVIERVRHG